MQANIAIFNALSSLHAFQANDFDFNFFRRRASLEIVFLSFNIIKLNQEEITTNALQIYLYAISKI